MDTFVSDERATYYHTYKNRKIKFFDADADDPDHLIKQCYLLVVAAATELEDGTENLWKRGSSGGRRMYPDFGKYLNKEVFKCFCSAAPYLWAKKDYWFMDKRDKTWDIFIPCLQDFNEKRQNLIKSIMVLILDESMSGWRPKSSKLGGLPSYTFEPRKSIPLGTMLRNGAEAVTGVILYQDIVQTPEFQTKKTFHEEPSHMPDNSLIPSHTAEVLRQVEGSGMKDKGWVGGDAWFGSVITAIETKKRFGVDSTWIIKNNNSFFPKTALLTVMKARHGTHPAGNWVVFTAKIAGIDLIVMAYAWSQKGISFFLSTCGSTAKSRNSYRSHFENEYGQVDFKELPRPKLAEFLFEYLPLIDEHNRMRQDRLALEKCWPTKNCWFRLIVTLVGMSVVDLQRVYRNKDSKYLEWDVFKFADYISADLKVNIRKVDERTEDPYQKLVRMKNKDGEFNVPLTKSQRERGLDKGNVVTANCFMCKKYEAVGKYIKTSWQCAQCCTPICLTDRKGKRGRERSCLDEHVHSDEVLLQCRSSYPKPNKFPPNKRFCGECID